MRLRVRDLTHLLAAVVWSAGGAPARGETPAPEPGIAPSAQSSTPAEPPAAEEAEPPPQRIEPRRLTLGFEASGAFSSRDVGFFDYTDHEQTVLRLARASVTASLRLGSRAALLGEVRAAGGEGVRASALYLRVRPWPERPVDIQAGRIPPTFGAFARRSYASDNPLIGYPLGYQYLTTLRPDAVPASADDLLGIRGRGWLSSFPVGSFEPAHGLPLVAATRWDTGAQVRVGSEPASLTAAVTTGSLSNPRVRDDNDGKQVALRGEVRPAVGWVFGVSAAQGAFLERQVLAAMPVGLRDTGSRQRALGADAEYSRGYWLLRGEGIWSEWRLPGLPPVSAVAVYAEARRTLLPGFHAAARVDRLAFSRLSGRLFGGRPTTWDAPVTRIEAGGGYRLARHVSVKAIYQYNWRDTLRFRTLAVVAGQVSIWY